jgi:predicted TIM-barrel fold metal-dependent hydrolase
MGADRLLMVSADGHIGAPMSVYRDYMEAKYLDAFDTWTTFHFETLQVRIARKMEKHVVHPPMRPYPTPEQIWDPATRYGVLDQEGVAAEVLFPGPDFTDEHTIPFKVVIGANPDRQDPELEAAGESAYNRFLADFIAAAAPRAIGLVNPSRFDIDQGVRDVEWAKERGFGGVLLQQADGRLPYYWDERWEPIWAACEELELPVHFHGGTGWPDDFRMWQGDPGAQGLMWSEGPFWASRPLKFLICGGVLDRHPRLKVVMTETSNGWVPDYLAALDAQDSLRDVLKLKPSEYWARQCYLGASLLRRTEWPLRTAIGIDHMMWGVDFPHPEGSWDRTKVWLQCLFGEVGGTEEELRRLCGGTALEVYGIDPGPLRAVANRVGFAVDEVMQPPPGDLDPAIVNMGGIRLA